MSGVYSCLHCNKQYKHQRSLVLHKLSCKEQNGGELVKLFKCLICDKGFTRLNILKNHMKKGCSNSITQSATSTSTQIPSSGAITKPTTLQDQTNTCNLCGLKLSSIYTLESHQQSSTCKKKTEKLNILNQMKMSSSSSTQSSLNVTAPIQKRKACRQNQTRAKKIKTIMKFCSWCKKEMNGEEWKKHVQSADHIEKASVKVSSLTKKMDQVFGDRLVWYLIKNPEPENVNIEQILNNKEVLKDLSDLLIKHLQVFNSLKFQIKVYANCMKPSISEKDESPIEEKVFHAKFINLSKEDDTEEKIAEAYQQIIKNKEIFLQIGSGWTVVEFTNIKVNINKYQPFGGGSIMKLPKCIENRKACINPRQNDERCFQHAIRAALLHKLFDNEVQIQISQLASAVTDSAEFNKKSERIRKNHFNRLCNVDSIVIEIVDLNYKIDWIDSSTGIEFDFPMKINKIKLFEQTNPTISINVFGVDDDQETIVGPYHLCKEKKEHHINLLLFEDQQSESFHYVWIKCLSRLVHHQIKKNCCKPFICESCLVVFTSKQNLDKHTQNDCLQIVHDFPKDSVEFENHQKSIPSPFVIYADIECILQPVDSSENTPEKPWRITKNIHVPSSAAYFIKCRFDQSLDSFKTFQGADCTQQFIQSLFEETKKLAESYLIGYDVGAKVTADERKSFISATQCFICNNPFIKEHQIKENHGLKILEHCHLTGKYRGAAHQKCNLKYRLPATIPVFFHNFSKYDSHLIIRDLMQNESYHPCSIVPNNTEVYTAVNKKIILTSSPTGKRKYLTLSFRDSLRFLTSSLEKLVEAQEGRLPNLQKEMMKDLQAKNISIEDIAKKIELVQQKGVFPYEAMKSFDDYERSLPSMKEFKSTLNGEKNISSNDYQHAQRVYSEFGCENMWNYSDLYLKTDVLLLADVFENFRSICLDSTLYGLDPANYYTAPGLAWDAMLKVTNVKIDLLTDLEMMNFVRSGIRGGLSQASYRHAEAKNKYTTTDSVQDPSYLMYLDKNNLYGHAMTQKLPLNNFKWDDVSTWNEENIRLFNSEGDVGYIFGVDIEYPFDLHDKHNYLPFLPEKIVIKKVEKLCATLQDKTKYVVHIKNLQQALHNGLKIKKIHRVLSFNQSAWMATYINLNNKRRSIALTKAEKDLCKLMNNAVFGKTIENILKRRKIHLCNQWETVGKKKGAGFYIASPQLKRLTKFDDNLVACELQQCLIHFDKPIHVGFVVLEMSKLSMYEFHYDFMDLLYGEKAKLCYTDTDSFIYHIHTDDLYEDLREIIHKPQKEVEYFDTSDYPYPNQFGYERVNKKRLGAMKDELNGKIMTQFIGLRSKCYSYICKGDDEPTNKAKGTKICITKTLTQNEYQKSLEDPEVKIYKQQQVFRSNLHRIYTENINKVAINSADDKRHILANRVDTLALGHYKIDLEVLEELDTM